MKSTVCWRKKVFLFGMIILSMLFIIGCSDSGDDSNPFANNGYTNGNPNAKIATASTIALGAANPTVTVTGKDFKPGIVTADLRVDVGTTGLTLGSVIYDSATQITVAFTGVATTGKVRIKARGSAFQGDFDDSNTLTITVPAHIATASNIPCGAANPTVTVNVIGTDFKNSIAAADLTINVGTTGLTLGTVTYVNATQITIAFTGVAAGGSVKIQANASAFNPVAESASNTLSIGICDPVNPWLVTATPVPWLTSNPYGSKHDGGWVYSAREDVLYAMYGNNNSGKYLYRIDHIGFTYSLATTFLYDRHGTHPVIDDTGTYVYITPSQNTNQLERYNTLTLTRETLAAAPTSATFSHGAWKNGKLWMVLDNGWLYSYDPSSNTWSGALHDFSGYNAANVASSGLASNLIYIIVATGGAFYSYDVTNGTTTTLASQPYGFDLWGNGLFTWFGDAIGFIYAVGGCDGTPAIYDISSGVWHSLSDSKNNGNCNGHATYDNSRQRLYMTDGSNNVFYYQY